MQYILPKHCYPSTKLQTVMCKEARALKSVMNTTGLRTDWLQFLEHLLRVCLLLFSIEVYVYFHEQYWKYNLCLLSYNLLNSQMRLWYKQKNNAPILYKLYCLQLPFPYKLATDYPIIPNLTLVYSHSVIPLTFITDLCNSRMRLVST